MKVLESCIAFWKAEKIAICIFTKANFYAVWPLQSIFDSFNARMDYGLLRCTTIKAVGVQQGQKYQNRMLTVVTRFCTLLNFTNQATKFCHMAFFKVFTTKLETQIIQKDGIILSVFIFEKMKKLK